MYSTPGNRVVVLFSNPNNFNLHNISQTSVKVHSQSAFHTQCIHTPSIHCLKAKGHHGFKHNMLMTSPWDTLSVLATNTSAWSDGSRMVHKMKQVSALHYFRSCQLMCPNETSDDCLLHEVSHNTTYNKYTCVETMDWWIINYFDENHRETSCGSKHSPVWSLLLNLFIKNFPTVTATGLKLTIESPSPPR